MLILDAQARVHLHAEDDDDISVYIGAAERAAQEFLNRRVYADQAALVAAQLMVTDGLLAARATYDAADAAANLIDDRDARLEAKTYAFKQYMAAHRLAAEIRAGIVIDDMIRAAMLLTIGHLYANREDVVAGVSVSQLPIGADRLLQPYRVGLGV
jgi:hypothetical protein